MLKDYTYSIASKGLATSFEETETPPVFALGFKNRFINAAGGAEKRRGIELFNSTYVNSGPNLTGIHEYVSKTGTETLMVSGEGKIYRWDTSSWTLVYTSATTGGTYKSSQIGEKLVFVNGHDEPMYTEDCSAFSTLLPIIEQGQTGTKTKKSQLVDTEVSGWQIMTPIAIGDIIHNITLSGYAVVTEIATATITHTEISSTAQSYFGRVDLDSASGHKYRVLDTVEANEVPVVNSLGSATSETDNLFLAGFESSTTGCWASAVSDWSTTNMEVGDWVRNTGVSTPDGNGCIAQVTALSGKWLRHTGVSGQAAFDQITLYTSPIPKAKTAHTHYGRLYLNDSKDRFKIKISGPGDPQDQTTDAGTLDSSLFNFGALQPIGDVVESMTSFQRFFVCAGKKYTFLYEGTDPIMDTSVAADWKPVGMFPQGVVSDDSLITVGNDAVIISPDGVQSFSLQGDSSTLGQENLSEALKTSLRDEIAAASEDSIIAFHYPKRSWVCFKIGNMIYVYNYSPFFGQGSTSEESGFSGQTKRGSWSKFDGKFARQNVYYVRRNGTLMCAGQNGAVYEFDTAGVYDDDGEVYSTEYQTPWLSMESKLRSKTVKSGMYIQPTFNSTTVTYTVRAEGGFDVQSTDSINVEVSSGSGPLGSWVVGTGRVGGSPIQDKKYPLTWRGTEARLTFTTNDSSGPDVLSRFTIFFNAYGKH